MAGDQVKPGGGRATSPPVTALLVVAAATFVATALYAPRAVRPGRLPILTLDPSAVHTVLERDRREASRPPDGRWVRELRAVYAELGRLHHGPPSHAAHLRARQTRAQRLGRAVRERHGDAGLAALRAEVVVQLEDALAGRLSATRSQELLGGFERQLQRYHARDARGRRRAPWLTVCSMFKARWNSIFGFAPTAGFAAVEVQAYEGWLALHGVGAPAGLRYQAAVRFAQAGGHRGDEAVAIWATREGDLPGARAALARALASRRSVRLRNYAIALQAP